MKSTWKSSLPSAAIALSLLVFSPPALTCTHPVPPLPLERGGAQILHPPEFFFELEMKHLSKTYPSPFKAKTPDRQQSDSSYPKFTAEADLSDFQAALDSGRITPPDAATAVEEHLRTRDLINTSGSGETATPPPEWKSEFSIYHEGALAHRRAQPEAARKAWETLLALPEKERHYRTTWAEFMLGKLDLAEGNAAKAIDHFRAVRQAAESGFGDSLALASSSYGWEALIELNRDNLRCAAELYLTQLASGDLSAVDSLKVIRAKADRTHAAADPLLRKIVTSGILCDSTTKTRYGPEEEYSYWLRALEAVQLDRIDEADRLGWIAYSYGRFDEAEAWLNRADPNTALSLWLKAKLDFRAGRLTQATTSLRKAIKLIPEQQALEISVLAGDELLPQAVAQGDLGLLFLARADFKAAFRQFLKGGHWQDAAYIAERILPLETFCNLVDREFPPDQTGLSTERDVRGILGRRLVRAKQFKRARPYLPASEQSILDSYATALATVHKKGISKAARAEALLEAARITRNHGMELMGTELAPDSFETGGSFPGYEIWKERLEGKYRINPYPWNEENLETKPLVVPSSKRERELLKQSGVKPEKRFHYRYVAAEYAWQAAKLLPDNSEKTADVLNTAGGWLKKRDPKAADHFYQALERRCPDTEIGKAAIAIRWFPDMQGSWSGTQKVD